MFKAMLTMTAIALAAMYYFLPSNHGPKLDPATSAALTRLNSENATFLSLLEEARGLGQATAKGQLSQAELKQRYERDIIPRMEQIHQRVYGIKSPNQNVYKMQTALYQFMVHLKMAMQLDLRNRHAETGRYLASAKSYAQAFDGGMARLTATSNPARVTR